MGGEEEEHDDGLRVEEEWEGWLTFPGELREGTMTQERVVPHGGKD